MLLVIFRRKVLSKANFISLCQRVVYYTNHINFFPFWYDILDDQSVVKDWEIQAFRLHLIMPRNMAENSGGCGMNVCQYLCNSDKHTHTHTHTHTHAYTHYLNQPLQDIKRMFNVLKLNRKLSCSCNCNDLHI